MLAIDTMLAARLHGPADLRIEEIPVPGPPAAGQALLRISAVGICGSDLHTYRHARIGDTCVEGPFILGHEFAGVVEAVGEGALDGEFQPLKPGTRVAVDPAQPCGLCELCERGNPNLCLNLHFCGTWPDQGSLCQWMHMPARSCFPIPDAMDDATAVLLEPLGVAIHAVDLAKIRVGHRVAILGAGPIGLCILQLVRLAGADAVYIADKFPWRLALAQQFGATGAWCCDQADPVAAMRKATGGRGVDVAIEAAWCDRSVDQAAEMLVHGGRLVVAGIPEHDRLLLKPSVARRKGLTIVMVRRMKHVYRRAIRLAVRGAVDLAPLVSHRVPLEQVAETFALNADYRDGVVKAIVEM
jgi:L-iditol 2-dehydrogenase